jgi:hypothetical protein
MFRPFAFIFPIDFNIMWLSILSTLLKFIPEMRRAQ